jgi:hypothetical protein
MRSSDYGKLGRSPLERAKDRVTILELGERLFPGWKPGKSCHSPFREDRNPSFSIFADNHEWKDHGTGEHGDAVDFLAKARGIDISTAARELIAMANTGAFASASIRRRVEMPPIGKQPIVPMPPDVATIWDEGVEHLIESARTQQNIEEWRNWSAGSVLGLADECLLGCPLVDRARRIAFPVQFPFANSQGQIGTYVCGFHYRIEPRGPEIHAGWRYRPDERTDGAKIPALPYVIGAGFLPYARTVTVTEGQWDAITLALAAGWLASDTAWPEHLTLFAVRGASAWRPLIDFWGDYFPKDARFILFADGDEAGCKWREPGNLADTLHRRGHRVRIVRPRQESPKDLNDIHRSQPITKAEIAEWLATGGRVL